MYNATNEQALITIKEQDEYIDSFLPQIAEYSDGSILDLKGLNDRYNKDVMIPKIIRRMIKEELVRFSKPNDYFYVEMDTKGYECIMQGGYLKQKENIAISVRYERYSSYVLIFGAGAAGIYYMFELLKYLC